MEDDEHGTLDPQFQNLLTGQRHSGIQATQPHQGFALVSKPFNRSKAFRAVSMNDNGLQLIAFQNLLTGQRHSGH